MTRHRARIRLVTTTAAPAAIRIASAKVTTAPRRPSVLGWVLVVVDGRGGQRDEAEGVRGDQGDALPCVDAKPAGIHGIEQRRPRR